MRRSMVTTSLTVVFFLVLLPPTLVASDGGDDDSTTDSYTLEYTECSTSRNFSSSSSSSYQVNLSQLLATLPSTAVNSSFNGTAMAGSAPDAVFASAMCQADMPWPDQCRRCLEAATGAAASACPVSRNASIGYRGCVLSYSETPIELINPRGGGIAYLTQNHPASVPEIIAFQQTRTELFTALSGAASISPIRIAAGNRTMNATHRMYGLAQCIRYLPGDECSRCITSLVTRIPATALLSEGVSLAGLSCYARYDLQPFRVYDPTADHDGGGTTPAADHDGGGTTMHGLKGAVHPAEIIAILVSLSVIVMLVVLMVARHYIRKRKFRNLQNILGLTQFSYNEIKEGTQNFRTKLGEGGFGQVYQATLSIGEEKKEVAVKRVTDQHAATNLLGELSLLAKLNHTNMVQLVGWSFSGKKGKELYVCNELLSMGSLDRYIFGPERLPWGTRYDIIKGICEGLRYLHEKCGDRIIAHMDIKPNNILLDENWTPKIADLGLSRVFNKDRTQILTAKVIGTFGYLAPEYKKHGKIGRMCDIYSLGVLIMAIVMGKGPEDELDPCGKEFIGEIRLKFEAGYNDDEQLKKDASLKDGDCLEDMKKCMALALRCVDADPTVRPKAEDIYLILHTNDTDPHYVGVRMN